MKLFKYSAIALFASISSFLSNKSDAYLIQHTGDTQYVAYAPIMQPNDQEYLIGNLTVNEYALQPGQYRLTNENGNEFGFIFIDDNLPGRLVQINMQMDGQIDVYFNGNTYGTTLKVFSNDVESRRIIYGNHINFMNEAFDTELRIHSPMMRNELRIPLFPNIEVQNLNFSIPLLPNQVLDEISSKTTNIVISDSNVHQIDNEKVLNQGFIYRYELPKDVLRRIIKKGPSSVALFQNNILLNKLNCFHGRIEQEGMGRTSFCENGYLYFSTLDNTPLAGKKFTIGYLDEHKADSSKQIQYEPDALEVFDEISNRQLNLTILYDKPFTIDNRFIKGPQGFMYRYYFPEDVMDLLEMEPDLTAVLYENNVLMDQINCWHGNIENIGMGKTSFCENGYIYFSTLDNSPIDGKEFSISIMKKARELIIERPKNPNLIFIGDNLGMEPSLAQTENAHHFAQCIYNLASNLNTLLERSKIIYMLNDYDGYNLQESLENLRVLLEADLENIINFINEETSYYFPNNFEVLLAERAKNYITQDYNRFINFVQNTSNELLRLGNRINDANIRKILADYKLLLTQHNKHFGATPEDCYQKFAGNIFVGTNGLRNADLTFFNKIDTELKAALEGKGGWPNYETVMNATIVANTHYIETSNFVTNITTELGGNVAMLASKEEVREWLDLKQDGCYNINQIDTALNQSYARSLIPGLDKPISNITAYQYMLYVVSHIRFCCDNLIQHNFINEANDLKFKLIVAFEEQNGSCDKGMVGRMFTMLVATLSEYCKLVTMLNNAGIEPVIRD